jgi:hypothetical protein
MVNWQEPCSSRRAHRPDRTRRLGPWVLLACSLATACGRAADQAGPAGAPPPSPSALSPPTLCAAAATGSLHARLSGAIEAEIDWNEHGEPQCRGSVRPAGDGLRLVYRGTVPDVGPVLIVLGAGPLRPGESARNVPVNLTLVREGSGEFFATQGDDKCAFDELKQTPANGSATAYRVEGRGYCTQPARAVGGDRAVLVSRFDVTALVDELEKDAEPTPADSR